MGQAAYVVPNILDERADAIALAHLQRGEVLDDYGRAHRRPRITEQSRALRIQRKRKGARQGIGDTTWHPHTTSPWA